MMKSRKFNPFMYSELFTLTLWTGLFQCKVVWLDYIATLFLEIPVLNANSVDPDQIPRSAMFDLAYTVSMFLLLI